jgi:HlyD family secretion protein
MINVQKRLFSAWIAALQFLRPLYWSIGLCFVTGTLCLAFAYLIIWPAYKNPIARMYTSKLGYSTVIRKTHGAFPVEAATVTRREIVGKFIGEGLTQSEPIQVPMIAMAPIKNVNAIEGQRVKKGDVIVELDRSKIELKILSARTALATAQSELERVKLGTVNVLQHERPDMQLLLANSAAEKTKIAQQLLEMHEKLRKSNIITEQDLALKRLEAINAEFAEKESKLAAEMAKNGRESSIRIAESAIQEAELVVQHRLNELDDYTSRSPADGIVERVLVHTGEYNQDPGRPAVLIAAGLWFECYLDQTALGRVHVGDEVEVRLAAYQDHLFQGSITHIRPLVNFALGGPETNRPIRPLGTGSPEWPSTFSVRIEVDPSDHLIVPGLTGYATVLQRRTVLTVPQGTVSAISGNRGIVYVVGSDNQSFEPRSVVTGIKDGRWIEVREGLKDGDVVISDGYQVLQPGDRIAVRHQESSDASTAKNDATIQNPKPSPHTSTNRPQTDVALIKQTPQNGNDHGTASESLKSADH